MDLEADAVPEAGPSQGGEGAAVSGPIDGETEPETIQQLQMKLYSLGLLSTDGLVPGELDEQTLNAVAEFQLRTNEQYGTELEIVDPLDPEPVVDAETVRMIFAS